MAVLFFALLFVQMGFAQTVTITATSGVNKTGSVSAAGVKNDGNMININTGANRGWAQFNLSSIPPGATIVSANALFTTFSSVASGALNNVFGFLGDPNAIAGATLYTACATAPTFNNSTWTAGAQQVKALNASGIAFLQANLAGSVNLGYVRASTNNYNIYGYPGLPADQPALQITYTVPCAGTPTPGNTLASVVGACSGVNFTLSNQNVFGTGSTYQWESADDLAFSVNQANLGTAATQVVSQVAPKYYRCTVNCAGGGGSPTFGTSTPLLVPMSAPLPVDFAPVTPFPSNCWGLSTTLNRLLRDASNGYGAPGTGSAKWDFFNASAASVHSITSPAFTPVGAGQQIRFDVAGTTFSAAEIDRIVLETSSTGPAGPWTVVADMNNNGGVLQTVPAQTGVFTPTPTQWNTLAYPIAAGTNAVQFRGISAFGNNVYIDNITIEPVPTCQAPSAITAIGTNTTSAAISWTCAGCTGPYIVEYGPVGSFTTPGTGNTAGAGGTIWTGGPIAGTSTTITGLVHPTQYRVFVRQECTAGVTYSSNGFNPNGTLFYSQPPFDQCQSITSIPSVGPGGTIALNGNNFGATDAEGFGANVSWEAFTLTSCVSTLNINYCGSTPPRTNAFINLFLGCPQSAGFIAWNGAAGPACPNTSVNIPYVNVPAGTYYIAIMNQANAQGPYGINVVAGAACPTPPANDLCSVATPIACGQTLTGTTVNATRTGAPASICNGFLNNSSVGVWYSASGLCGNVTASLCTTLPVWNSKMAIYSGNCGALTCVTTNDNFCGNLSQATWAANASTTYYIYVLGATMPDVGTFSLALTCANTPIAATASVTDNCIGGTFDVGVNMTSDGGAPATINWVATPGGPGSMPAVVGPNLIPVSFPVGTQVSVSLSNGLSGCGLNLGDYYSNCPVTLVCGVTNTVTHCYTNGDPRTFTFSTPTPGETVTVTFTAGTMDPSDVIRAYSGTNSGGTPIATLTGTFANLFGVTGVSIGQDLFIEIDSDGSNSCFSGQQSTWIFQAECTPGCVDPDGTVTENITCGTYSFTLDVQVTSLGDGLSTDLEYTVGGVPQTPITGLLLGDIETLGPFPIGTNVSMVLAHETDGACDHSLGSFNGTTTFCPPPGWTCALPLDVNSYPYVNANTTCGAGNDLLGTQCALGAAYGGGEDFIYRLNIATPGDYQISLQLTGGFSFAGWFLKSTANCTVAASCLGNAVTTAVNGTATGVVNLGVGSYDLVIDSRPLPFCVSYVLSVVPFVPVAGDNCAIAIPLTSALTCVPTTATNVGATQSIAPLTCQGFTSASALDVWFSFVATSAAHTVTVDGLGVFDAIVDVRSGACNGTNIGCADATVGGLEVVGLAGLTIGQTYLVRVYGWAGQTGVFDICITESFDPCASISNITACDVPTGDVSVASGAGGFDNYGGPFPTPGQEAIFTFTPTLSGVHGIVVNNLVGSWVDFFFKAAGTCDATGWSFVDDVIATGPVTPSGVPLTLTAGTTYYIMWDPEDTDPRTVDFQITCPIPPPANDACANAITLVPGLTCVTTAGTNGGATQSVAPATCSGFTSSSAFDVWYQFVATSTAHRASAQGDPNFDGIIEMFSGPCDGTSLGCSDNTVNGGLEQIAVTGLTVGQTYYVRVYGWAGTTGTFDICVETPDCQGVYGGTALPGTSCNDGNANTVLDVYGPNCVCAGTACTTDLKVAFQLDGTSNVNYELRQQGSNILVQSGTAFAGPTSLDLNTCLPNGCFYLRVIDDIGDGITGGGYILTNTTSGGQRIIDNRNNFLSGSVSAIANNEGFCLPMGVDRVLTSNCDKLDWRTNDYIVTNDNAAVTAIWNTYPSGSAQRANSGYEMWWFNPNGGYSFRRFQSHATNNGITASATRACNFRINSWSGNQLQQLVLYNVRVRTRTNTTGIPANSVNTEWGPTCRFILNPLRAQCPLTKLMDAPGNQFFSCGSSRNWGSGNYVHAKPVTRVINGVTSSANRYQFRFRIAAENFSVTRTSNTGQYFVQLNWGTLPLQPGKQYDVDVRASFDNGATWCTNFVAPFLTDPWGDVCKLTINGQALQGGGQNIVMEGGASLRLFPNPNQGDQFFLNMEAIEEGVNTVSVDIYDLFGKRVITRTIAVQDGFINTVFELNGEMAAGMYMVNITAGENTHIERLVIQP